MKRLLFALFLLTLATAGLSLANASAENKVYLPVLSCPDCDGPAAQPTNPPAPTPDPASYAAEMVELVNQARVAAGCPAAVADPTLMRAAQDWSATMARSGNYTHSGGGYYQGYGYNGLVLENIAGGAETPNYAFQGWMNSPTHKGNLEFCYPASDPSYDPTMPYSIGVGYQDGYWTLAIGWE